MEVTVSLSLDTDNPIERSLVEVIRSIPKPSRHVSLVTALTLGFAFSSRPPHQASAPIQQFSCDQPEPCLDFPEPPFSEQVSEVSSSEVSPAPQGIHDYLQSFQC